jgi:hypothetical protein
MQSILLFLYKLWRITTARALEVTGTFAMLQFVEDDVFPIALAMVATGLFIYYVSSYTNLSEMTLPIRKSPEFDWAVWSRRMFRITLNNGFWILTGITFVLFVTGMTLIRLTIITVLGYAMMYIESYRTMEEEESVQK